MAATRSGTACKLSAASFWPRLMPSWTSPLPSLSTCFGRSTGRRSRGARSGASSTVRGSPSRTAHASEQDRPDVAARRLAWFETQPDLDPERLVFINETGASTKMARLRGRAPRGRRCRAPVPHGHWLTTTFTGALRTTGMTAPMLLDEPMNRDASEAYVEQVLAPTLSPGDVVILDNLPAHRSNAGARCRRGDRHHAPLPAAILARLQPDRERLRQAQGHPAQGRHSHTR